MRGGSHGPISPLAQRVVDVLSRHTAFPWPVLLAECRRVGIGPGSIDANALRAMLPFLAQGVARFTSPTKGEQTRADLEQLL